MDQESSERCQKIADFLRRRVTFTPSVRRQLFGWDESISQLPTKEQFASSLLQDGEYRSLQLGTWLGTIDGEVIETAVGMVIAPVYVPEYELAVDGLMLAARLQQQEGSQVAGQLLLIGLGAGLVAAGIASMVRSAA